MLSNGEAIPHVKVVRQAYKAMCRAQKALARCRRGSKRRLKTRDKLARLNGKIGDTRRTHLHQVSQRLINAYDATAIEKLSIKGMVAGMLATQIIDASSGMQRLRYFGAKDTGAVNA
jgi:putative transposase